ncbi:MAG: hypothetical protein EA376_03655 [Phycisphaeraceae bacterium]|nr:MAG: hypothetical protein EA376_03655 [Phycisphaeraceae bacterium]
MFDHHGGGGEAVPRPWANELPDGFTGFNITQDDSTETFNIVILHRSTLDRHQSSQRISDLAAIFQPGAFA